MKSDVPKGGFDFFELPVFDKPQIERWPLNMTWDQAMSAFDVQRKQYMRTHYSAADRLRDKNPEPFRMD
ncbi:MAG TPA: hypothetical protein VFS35_05295 [Terrimicrobiaceae bacterium]|nr:hypothetical protein [Terrimicrobiaceae bacterium]